MLGGQFPVSSHGALPAGGVTPPAGGVTPPADGVTPPADTPSTISGNSPRPPPNKQIRPQSAPRNNLGRVYIVVKPICRAHKQRRYSLSAVLVPSSHDEWKRGLRLAVRSAGARRRLWAGALGVMTGGV